MNVWHKKEELPKENTTVITCVNDNGYPQCLSFAYYDYKKNAWVDLLSEDDEEENEIIFDYWMYVPELNVEE